jgi:glutathione S-transferase
MRAIFHHYKESPYAEKIRILLGHKQMHWCSVTVPRVAPKPDLTALTAGYRKVPVLQMGADVVCDTRLIAQEIEALSPMPALPVLPGSLSPVLESWVDQHLFGRVVAFTFGSLADYLPDELLADRAALRGAPLERGPLKAAVPLAAQELHTQMAWLEHALADRPFFNGPHPACGDFTLYATLWFAANGRFDFSAYPRLNTWMQLMKAFGHGTSTPMTAAEALEEARTHAPRPLPDSSADSLTACGLQLGQAVRITPELLGQGTDVVGELMALNHERTIVRHQHEHCGTVHVHLPRLGYRLRAA